MNLFDLAAGLILLVSAIVGFSRGAVLELVTLFAFTIAAALAVYLLPFTAPFARHSVHPAWAANAAAVIVTFLIAYIALRMLGSSVSRALRSQATLGLLDRAVGLGFGVVRALVILGVVYLVFTATPFGRAPGLISSGRLYPLARLSGRTLASAAPGGLKDMTGLGQMLKQRATDAAADVDAEQSGIQVLPTPAGPPADAPALAPDDAPPAPPAPTNRTLKVITAEPDHPHSHHHRTRSSESME